MIGELLDHYRILELVGRGAMGVVYKALDVNLDRQVAVKVMSAEARNDPDFVERFRQEARMQGALNHPNVAMLFDYFIHDGAPVAVMELIDGESLEQLIRRRGAVPAHESIPIFKQALRGVAAAHRAGIIHRDLKPSNLMVTREDIVKVMDFGIAKRQGSPGATKVSSTSIGSPLYMAPEQILGRAVDCRTDIYALGLTLYELLSGNRPFNPRGKAEFMVLNAHVNDLPEPPTVYRYGIPQPLVDAVMRALAKDPNARFQSADEFMQALPDMPAPTAAVLGKEASEAPASGPRVGPTGTVALAKAAPSSATMTLEYAPPPGEAPAAGPEPSGTMVLEYAPAPSAPLHATAQHIPTATLRLDVLLEDEDAPKAPAAPVTASAGPTGTLRLPTSASSPGSSAGAPPAAQDSYSRAPPRAPRPRAYRLGLAALLVATLALGMLWRHAKQTRPPDESLAFAPAVTPQSPQAPAPAPGVSGSASAEAPVAPPAEALGAASAQPGDSPPPAAPARGDLAGIWSGSYVDASGRQLLRVVSLSIARVRDDGGIEGSLQYEAASGDGECQLHPRRSTYSAPEQRLLLSPESCSPHYPKELGVPLDFEGVSPQASTLRNGRIAAPAGQVIRVRLKRVSGALPG